MNGKRSAGGRVCFVKKVCGREDEERAGRKSGNRGKMRIWYDTSLDVKRIYEAWQEREQEEELPQHGGLDVP
jgi:hypothetical protein